MGPDYCFKTHVLTDGPVVDGELKGNLIIVGFGDPSSSSRMQSNDPFQAFRLWASNLKSKGVHTITGDIIGDAGSFEETALGQGWAWDDLPQGYAAPVSALQFNGNLIELQIVPGMKAGSLASITMKPLADYLTLKNSVVTGTAGNPAHIEIEHRRSGETVRVRGTLPLNSPPIDQSVAVQFPVRYYLSALKHALNEEGIKTPGCRIKEMRNVDLESASLLWIHPSPSLSELLIPTLKMSLNLAAETVVRTLGLEVRGEGTFASGKEVVEDTLGTLGISKDSYAYADGSGLSRLNLVSADTLVQILKFMHRHRDFSFFYNALAIAGIDGTMEIRMKGTKAENNVHAKTGTLSNVSSLAGYVQTADGEMLTFAIIANNFLASKNAAEKLQDKAVLRLVNFTRKEQNNNKTDKVRTQRKVAPE